MQSAVPVAKAAPANPLSRVVRGFFTLAIGEVLNKGLSALVSIYLAIKLEAAGFGIYGYANALAQWFFLAVDLGLDFVATREVARRPELAGAYARRSVVIRTCAAAIVAVIYLALSMTLQNNPEIRLTLALYALVFFPAALTPKGVLFGLERQRPWAIAQFVNQLIFAAICLLWIFGPGDSWKIPVAQAVADTVQACIVIASLWTAFKTVSTLEESWWLSIRTMLPFAWNQWMRVLGYNFDLVLIGQVFGTEPAGWYTAAYRLVTLVTGFAALYGFNLLPAISRYYPSNVGALSKLAGQSLALTGAVVIPTAVGGSILAPQLVELLYRSGYEPAAAPLRILITAVAIIVLGGAFRNILIGCNRQQVDLRLVTISAVTNIALNLMLTPTYGLVAAASITVVSELIVFLGGWWLATRLIGPIPVLKSLAPALGSTVLLAALLLFLPLPWIVSALLAGLAYLTCLWFTGGVRVALGR